MAEIVTAGQVTVSEFGEGFGSTDFRRALSSSYPEHDQEAFDCHG